MTTDFSVWSSKNLIEWKKERMVLDVSGDLKWANIKGWAPDAIERNGTYYFYFSADHKIGVATAKSPIGPFVDALGSALLVRSDKMTTNTIDPYPLRFRRADPARIDYGHSKKRHGSILNISSDEYRRIQARWPVAAPSKANQT